MCNSENTQCKIGAIYKVFQLFCSYHMLTVYCWTCGTLKYFLHFILLSFCFFTVILINRKFVVYLFIEKLRVCISDSPKSDAYWMCWPKKRASLPYIFSSSDQFVCCAVACLFIYIFINLSALIENWISTTIFQFHFDRFHCQF